MISAHAESKQAPMQRITDRCANWLIPLALIIAIVTGCVTQNIVQTLYYYESGYLDALISSNLFPCIKKAARGIWLNPNAPIASGFKSPY